MPTKDDDKVLELILQTMEKVDQKVEKVNDKVEAIGNKVVEQNQICDNHTNLIKEIGSEQSKMNEILDRNTASLDEHIKRTAILEEEVVDLDKRITPLEDDRLRKGIISSFVKRNAKVIVTVIGISGTIAGIVFGVAKFFGY